MEPLQPPLPPAAVVPIPVELEAVALGLHISRMRRREVRGHQQRALLDAIGEQGMTRLAREIPIFAKAAVPLPERHLHRIVQRVPGKDRALAARCEFEPDLARRVSRRWLYL